MEQLCSNCTYCLVKINRNMVSTRNVDDAKPFASPAVVEYVRCAKKVWEPVTSLVLLTGLDKIAKKCQYYEEMD